MSFEEYNEILEVIGKEREAEGYILEWDVYDDFNGFKDFRKFVVKKYPNQRELTEEEKNRMVDYLIRNYGYWNAVDLTNNFDLVTDDFIVWVRGLREGEEALFWHWDEIDL